MQWRAYACPICLHEAQVRGLPKGHPGALGDWKDVKCRRCGKYRIFGLTYAQLEKGAIRHEGDLEIFRQNFSGIVRNESRKRELAIDDNELTSLLQSKRKHNFFEKLDLLIEYVTEESSNESEFVATNPTWDCSVVYGSPSEFVNLVKKGKEMRYFESEPGHPFHLRLDVEGLKRLQLKATQRQSRLSDTSGEEESREWDFFICHASEDKTQAARQIADALIELSHKVWLDEYELTVGDSLRQKIDEGLSKSKFGIVILSPNFFKKKWPQAELDGMASREINGRKVILPVWHRVDAELVGRHSPLLAARLATKTELGIGKVVSDIKKAFEKSEAT